MSRVLTVVLSSLWLCSCALMWDLDIDGLPPGDASTDETGEDITTHDPGVDVTYDDPPDASPDIIRDTEDEDGGPSGLCQVPGETRVSEETEFPGPAAMVWSGSEFGFAWTEGPPDRRVKFRRIGTDGTLQGSEAVISDTVHALGEKVDVEWSGSRYGVIWATSTHGEGVWFAVVGQTGSREGSPVLVSETPPHEGGKKLMDTLWTGSEWVVAWSTMTPSILLRRLDEAGTPVGTEVVVVETVGETVGPRIAWADTEIGLIWSDARHSSTEVQFARMQADGTVISTDNRITNSLDSSWAHSISWTGSEYGIRWIETEMLMGEYGPALLARLTKEGTVIETPTAMGETCDKCDSIWTGSEFIVTHNNGSVRRWSPVGDLIGGTLVIEVGTAVWSVLVSAWSGTSLGVSYIDNRYSDFEYYFLLVETCE